MGLGRRVVLLSDAVGSTTGERNRRSGTREITMGVYIYRLEPKVRKHAVYGEIGILTYWDKLEWADDKRVSRQNAKIARHNARWHNRLPRFVMFRDGDGTVYDYTGNRVAVYYDTEALPIAIAP